MPPLLLELLFLTTEHLYSLPTWLFCSVLIPSPVPSPVVIEDGLVLVYKNGFRGERAVVSHSRLSLSRAIKFSDVALTFLLKVS